MRNFLTRTATLLFASSSFATVSSTLVADTYIVKDGSGVSAKFYSVLDVYVKGSHLGDTIGGLISATGHDFVIATSRAAGVTRDGATGRITSGSITSDIFVQSSNSSWRPTNTDGKTWDSFIAFGARTQNATVTTRNGVLTDCLPPSDPFNPSPFPQYDVPGSNFIDNGPYGLSIKSSPYPGASENPFGRVSLYNTNWNSTYTDLDRSRLSSNGQLFYGAATASAAAANRIDPTTTNVVAGLPGVGGASLDFHWMIGRFAIEVTGKSFDEVITMNMQFNMVGKNGSGTNSETGTTFSGALPSMSAYKVSQFFAFAVPAPGASVLLALAGLCVRRRRNA
jgi:hypothetical protein